MKHPVQPVYRDKIGTIRFHPNKIIQFLIDTHPDQQILNTLARMRMFDDDDRTQLAQLIGYSTNGFGELDYVSDETWDSVSDLVEELQENEAAQGLDYVDD